jgi:excisionase family DNA binding protein
MSDSDRLLTQREAAEYLHYGVRTLQRWRREGIGPSSIKLPNGQRRYRKADLDEWLKRYGSNPEV